MVEKHGIKGYRMIRQENVFLSNFKCVDCGTYMYGYVPKVYDRNRVCITGDPVRIYTPPEYICPECGGDNGVYIEEET